MDLAEINGLKRQAKMVTQLLKAIANPNRLMILCSLMEKERLSVSELNRSLPLSQSALSQHLAILRRDGLVKTQREAQSIHYFLADEKIAVLVATLYHLYCKPQ
ncbi:MAG: metalloregulator ArsR/SmtB family transcription factor [Immundisolibacteraceae bacterium]|nr:metalloregulator ArsR/SmtB family transcription factor [Immundisolibacteraceae bacterium]